MSLTYTCVPVCVCMSVHVCVSGCARVYVWGVLCAHHIYVCVHMQVWLSVRSDVGAHVCQWVCKTESLL